MKVTVDQDNCISSGQCALHAPQTFDQRDEDGVVVLLTDSPPPEQADAVRQAAALCPARVITVAQ